MVRWSAAALIALCAVHLVVLGIDLGREAPAWLGLNMWTFDHWQPVHDQPAGMQASGAVFWATVGSFVAPTLVLGALVLWLDRRRLPIPAFVGWALAGWMALATAIMPPSGFPVGLAIATCLAIGLARRARSRARAEVAKT